MMDSARYNKDMEAGDIENVAMKKLGVDPSELHLRDRIDIRKGVASIVDNSDFDKRKAVMMAANVVKDVTSAGNEEIDVQVDIDRVKAAAIAAGRKDIVAQIEKRGVLGK